MLAMGSPTGLAVIDLDGNVILANRTLLALGAYDRSLPSVAVTECVVPAERDSVREAFERARAGEDVRFETAFRHAGGGSTVVGATLFPLYRRGEVVAVGARVHDRTHLRGAEKRRMEIQQSTRLRQLYLVAASAGRTPAQQIQATLELGNELLACTTSYVAEIVNDDAIVRFVAGTSVKGTGYSTRLADSFVRHALGEDGVFAVDDLAAPQWKDHPARRGLAWTAIVGTRIERFGALYGSLAFATSGAGGRHFSESDKDLVRLMGALCGSALERHAHEERLGTLAFYDALTGLPNRVLFDDRVEQTLIAAKRHGQRFALMFFDLDDFKDVNDRHGHAAGDELLRVVAHRLQAVARESDTVARHGGDEFVALQRFVRSSQDAMRLARRINETLRQPVAVDDLILAVSASIGVAIYPDHGTTARELLAHADAALYRAKHGGRDRAVLFKELAPAPIPASPSVPSAAAPRQ